MLILQPVQLTSVLTGNLIYYEVLGQNLSASDRGHPSLEAVAVCPQTAHSTTEIPDAKPPKVEDLSPGLVGIQSRELMVLAFALVQSPSNEIVVHS